MTPRPPPLQNPSVELAAIVMLVQESGNLRFLPPRVKGDADPHVCGRKCSRCAQGRGGRGAACLPYVKMLQDNKQDMEQWGNT